MSGSIGKPTGSFRRAMEYLQQQPDSQEEAGSGRALTIAISRQHGARGSEIARELGGQLDWHVYDRDLVDEITSDTELQSTLAETLDEKHKSWIVECLEAFAGTLTLSDAAYVHRLVGVLLSLAAKGQCIIVGRGAGFRLPQNKTLRVALVAPLRDRLERIAADERLSQQDAAHRIKKIDHERRMFVKDHFHKDPADMEHYDIVLNTTRFSNEQCTRLIIDACERVRQREEIAS